MPPTTPTPTVPSNTSPRHRTARLVASATAVAVGLLSLVVSATPALAVDNCPNAALRAQSNSIDLPHCRAYETVTPAYMEGFGFMLGQQNFSDDGNALSYISTGVFADIPTATLNNQYVASRTATGWTTTAYNPPYDRYQPSIGIGAEALSPDLRRSLWKMRAPSEADFNYYLREPDGSFTRIGQGSVPGVSPGNPATVGASVDLSHVVFGHGALTGSADAALWEFIGTGNSGLPRRVSITNDGQFLPGTRTCFGGMSVDGRVIVFTSGCGDPESVGIPLSLWARVGGSASVRASGSECTRGPDDPGGVCNEPASAFYEGAARDGSRVFFTTSQQLVNADTDATDDLYACDIPSGAPAPVGTANSCAALARVSEADGARVENVAAISEDGSRAYFVAEGVLADNLGTNGAPPAAGDHNLYLWTKDTAHPAGQTQFVARLMDPDLQNAQMTSDGRYLVFGTTSALIASGPAADIDAVADVYRYDARINAMMRLSTAASGAGGNGAFGVAINSSASAGASGYLRSSTVVTADGSMVVFETAEALSPIDTNGGPDVYLWHEGRVWLISGGVDGGGRPWITPSGRDLFFATRQAPSGDFYGDVYDARVGGGFDLRQPAPCSGDSCRGPLAGTPTLDRPSGVGSGGDASEGVRPAIGGIAKLSAADRLVLARGGKARLGLRVNRPGRVTLAASARLGGKSRRVALASAFAKRAGRVSIPFGLSRGARAALGRRGSLTIGLTIGFEDTRPKTLTVALRAAKPKYQKRGSR